MVPAIAIAATDAILWDHWHHLVWSRTERLIGLMCIESIRLWAGDQEASRIVSLSKIGMTIATWSCPFVVFCLDKSPSPDLVVQNERGLERALKRWQSKWCYTSSQNTHLPFEAWILGFFENILKHLSLKELRVQNEKCRATRTPANDIGIESTFNNIHKLEGRTL